MKYIVLLFVLVACAPPKATSPSSYSVKSLGSVWHDGGITLDFQQQTVAGGEIIVADGSGGSCHYDYGNTWTDPEQHDPNAGDILIADGAPVGSPQINCVALNGSWTYAVLISNSLQLCDANRCLEFQ